MGVSLGNCVKKEILNRAGSFDPVCPEHINTQPAIILLLFFTFSISFGHFLDVFHYLCLKQGASTLHFLSRCIIDTVVRPRWYFKSKSYPSVVYVFIKGLWCIEYILSFKGLERNRVDKITLYFFSSHFYLWPFGARAVKIYTWQETSVLCLSCSPGRPSKS